MTARARRAGSHGLISIRTWTALAMWGITVAMAAAACAREPAASPSASSSAPALPAVCSAPASPPTPGEVTIVRPVHSYAEEEQNVHLHLPTLLARMTVRALSPDRLIRAESRARMPARVAFTAPDALAMYRESTALAAQLSAAVSGAAAAAEKGRAMLMARHTRLAPVTGEHWDGRMRRFQRSAASLSAEGISPRRVVRVTTTGPLG